LSSIPYLELQLANPDLWNSQSNTVFIFGTIETIHENLKNIKISLHCITDFIRSRSLRNNRKENIPSLTGFIQAAWSSILSIYISGWDALKIDDNNVSFHHKISSKFDKKIPIPKFGKKSEKIPATNPIDFSNLPPSSPVPLRLSKDELNRSQYYKQDTKKSHSQPGKKKGVCTFKHHLGTLKKSSN